MSVMVKRTWQKILLGDMGPAALALGVALGTFLALLPTFGFSALIAFGLLPFLTKINKPAVFVAILFWNPLIQIPVYAASLQLGSLIFAGAPVVHYDIELLNHLYTFTRRFLVGHLIMTVGLTFLSFVLTYLTASAIPILKTTFRTIASLPTQLRTIRQAISQ